MIRLASTIPHKEEESHIIEHKVELTPNPFHIILVFPHPQKKNSCGWF